MNVSVHGLGLTLFGVIPRIYLGYQITVDSLTHDWIYMLMLSLTGMLSQYSIVRALKKEKNTSMVAIFFSLGVVFSFVYDLVLFDKPFLWRRFFGCLIVIGSIVVVFKTRK